MQTVESFLDILLKILNLVEELTTGKRLPP